MNLELGARLNAVANVFIVLRAHIITIFVV